MNTHSMPRLALQPAQAYPDGIGSVDSLEMDIDIKSPTTDMGIKPMTRKGYPFAGMLDFNTGRISFGGHRGMGANVWGASGPAAEHRSNKYRENTITSFLAAAQAGCKFLEFDVQVTSDNIPVIFHDNFVVFGDQASPTSSLVKSMSAADFKSLAPINSSSDLASLAGNSEDEATSTLNFPAGSSPPLGTSPMSGGSSPLGLSPRGGIRRLLRKHKNGEPAVAHEPSLQPWEVRSEDDFPTLAEVFAGIPAEVAFDIEVKMTTPNDVEKTPIEEVERVVTALLKAIDAANPIQANGRRHRAVMFSSFDPEVCTELKHRRPEFIVMFLSGGEAEIHIDSRRTSLSAAIDFAANAGLEGIIVDSAVLRERPQAVAAARQRGLEVLTYGLENDKEDWVSEQERLGVHGVIVDDVEQIAQAFANKTTVI